MNIQSLHIGMSVRHPQYGLGTVETISETTTDILFAGGKHTVAREATGLEAAEPQVTKSGLDIPLAQFIEQTVTAAINHLGLAKPDLLVEELGARCHHGEVVLHPADPTLQTKKGPFEVFFHYLKIARVVGEHIR